MVEEDGRVWLSEFGARNIVVKGGHPVAVVGPLKLLPAKSYTAVLSFAAMRPGDRSRVHTHPGPEGWYMIAGEQCLETPAGANRAKAGGTMTVPPAFARFAPAGVSRHCSPAIMYQPSGPGWVWTLERSPGRIAANERTAVYDLAGSSLSGPTTATGCPPFTTMLRAPNSDSQTRPSSSTTMPVALLAASAAGRFANVRMCQYTSGCGNCRPLSVAMLKQPNSGLCWPGGTSSHDTWV